MKENTVFRIFSLLFAAACVIVILVCEIKERSDDIFVGGTFEIGSDVSENFNQVNDTVKIDINEADAEKLTELPGIGKAIAERIVDYREEYGKFENIEEIMEVDGIGEGKFEKIKELITV